MKISRDISTKINIILDQFLPPFLRDSKLFMYIPFRLRFGSKTRLAMSFKENAPRMSKKEFSKAYEEISVVMDRIERNTDLNKACMQKILKKVKGKSVLDIACGNAILSNKLSKKGYRVTGADIIMPERIIKKYPDIEFIKANVEKMPFKDNSFDTVVCAHTLEHVQDLTMTVNELRRVAKKRLIIVVPKQRPYKYTFDLHLHFFPYEFSLLQQIGSSSRNMCETIGGDIFYLEDL